jgi:starch synthase (maltosyl-transferring)
MKKDGRAARPRFRYFDKLQPLFPPGGSKEADVLFALASKRIAIEAISHEIDGGRFPAKCLVGEPVLIDADIFSDGQDMIDV